MNDVDQQKKQQLLILAEKYNIQNVFEKTYFAVLCYWRQPAVTNFACLVETREEAEYLFDAWVSATAGYSQSDWRVESNTVQGFFEKYHVGSEYEVSKHALALESFRSCFVSMCCGMKQYPHKYHEYKRQGEFEACDTLEKL